jgi:hypothetical protein
MTTEQLSAATFLADDGSDGSVGDTNTSGDADTGGSGTTTSGGTSTTTTTTDTDTTTVTSLWDSLKSEELKLLANKKGWKTYEDALSSYQNLERMERVALPKEGDEESFNAFYNRLGRPEAPTGYSLENVEGLPEGADTSLFDVLKPVFHEAGITGKQAQKLAVATSKAQSEAALVAQTKFINDFNRQMKELGDVLGVDGVKELKQDARLASQGYGISHEEIDGLARVLGPKRAFETLQKLGRPLREGTVITGDTAPPGLSKEYAKAELARISKDPVLGKKIARGDKDALAEYNKLQKVAYS